MSGIAGQREGRRMGSPGWGADSPAPYWRRCSTIDPLPRRIQAAGGFGKGEAAPATRADRSSAESQFLQLSRRIMMRLTAM